MSERTVIYKVGPPIPEGHPHPFCFCGVRAVAHCQGCDECFCTGHWWKHSHTSAEMQEREERERAKR